MPLMGLAARSGLLTLVSGPSVRDTGLVTRKPLGVVLAILAFLIVGYWPVDVHLATDELADEFNDVEGFELIERDVRLISKIWADRPDLATITLRTDSDEPAEAFRLTMMRRGFSAEPQVAPFHDDASLDYYQRPRGAPYDDDMYRILDEDLDAGTVTIGISFFDQDSIILWPVAAVFSLFFAVPAFVLLARRPRNSAARREDEPEPVLAG
ncbi:MAG: hypothetical protein AAFP84_16890 [Actinomycetota bacterium]